MFDYATLGGIPFNRASMVVGEQHAGKSMMANKIVASVQELYPDQMPVYVDIEGTYDKTWAEAVGVDNDRLIVAPCETGEMAVDVACALVETRETSLVVIDSLAALTPVKEQESSAEDSIVALQSRLIGSMVRKVTASFIRERKRGHYVTVLYINQFRMNIGVMRGDPRVIPGGRALRYTTSLQWIVKNREHAGRDARGIEGITHNEHSFSITKNKLCWGPRAGEFHVQRVPDTDKNLTPGMVDEAHTLITYAKRHGFYTGEGGSAKVLAFDEYELSFRKHADAEQALRDDPGLAWDLRNALITSEAVHQNMPEEFIETIGTAP